MRSTFLFHVYMLPRPSAELPFCFPLLLFHRLPAFCVLYGPLYFRRAERPLNPLKVGYCPPQGLVLQLRFLQAVRQSLVALPGPSIVPLQTLILPFQLDIGPVQRAQHLDDLRQQGFGFLLPVGLGAFQRPKFRQYPLRVIGELCRQLLYVPHSRGQLL